MNYTLKQSNRKTIAIKVVDGTVIVYAPWGVKQSIIDHFVHEKTAWINEKLAYHRPLGIDVFHDTTALVFGERLNIECHSSSKLDLVITPRSLLVLIPKGVSEDRVNRFVEETLKKRLDHMIQPALTFYCNQLGIPVPSYIIRKYKRMYGRCSSNGTLGFNTYLFHEREAFIHYVILHECAHLIEFNHSKRFYALIESIMPNYKAIIAQQKRERVQHPDQ